MQNVTARPATTTAVSLAYFVAIKMKTTIKSKLTAAAIACALSTGTAGAALPAASKAIYDANPNDYRTALASILAHEAAGERDQVIAELPRIGITPNEATANKYLSKMFSAVDLSYVLIMSGTNIGRLTPPADTTTTQPATVETIPASTLTASKPAPVAWTALTPSTPAPITAPQGDAHDAKAQAQAVAMAAGIEAGKAVAPEYKTYVTGQLLAKIQTAYQGKTSPLKQDANGYYITGTQTSMDKAAAAVATVRASSQAEQAAQQVSIDNDRLTHALDDQRRNDNPNTRARVADNYNAMKQTINKQGTPTLSTIKPEDVPNTAPDKITIPASVLTPATPAKSTAPAGDAHDAKAQALAAAKTTGEAAGKAAAPQPSPAQTAEQARDAKAQALTAAQAQGIAAGKAAAPADTGAASEPQREPASHRLANDEKEIGRLNQNFSALKREVQENQRESRAGIAGAVAIASIPSARSDQRFMIGAGVGTFHGEQAVSVGASINLAANVAVKVGVSDSTNNDVAAGAGIGFGF